MSAMYLFDQCATGLHRRCPRHKQVTSFTGEQGASCICDCHIRPKKTAAQARAARQGAIKARLLAQAACSHAMDVALVPGPDGRYWDRCSLCGAISVREAQ